MCTSFAGCSVNKIHISFSTPNYFGSLWYSSFSNFRLRILIMSRLFVSEYKNNIKFKENKKKSKQETTA